MKKLISKGCSILTSITAMVIEVVILCPVVMGIMLLESIQSKFNKI